ncbi:hypothetical protein J1614_002933, partial [Plenodomus biglobosus]
QHQSSCDTLFETLVFWSALTELPRGHTGDELGCEERRGRSERGASHEKSMHRPHERRSEKTNNIQSIGTSIFGTNVGSCASSLALFASLPIIAAACPLPREYFPELCTNEIVGLELPSMNILIMNCDEHETTGRLSSHLWQVEYARLAWAQTLNSVQAAAPCTSKDSSVESWDSPSTTLNATIQGHTGYVQEACMDRMSNLPTIKCSSCAVEIDILHLADHVCAKTASPTTSVPAPTSPTSSASTLSPRSPGISRAATFGGPTFSNRPDGSIPRGRMPIPAQIDPNAANRPFRPLEPSPISNNTDPRQRSPRSAETQPPRSPFQMNRSATTPSPRPLAQPSPDYTSNLDCAFPPFPAKSETPRSAKPRTRDHLEPNAHYGYAAPSPLFAPLSPRTNAGENISKRLNTISPGPFDRRPSTASTVSTPPVTDAPVHGHTRSNTLDSIKSHGSAGPQRKSSVSNSTRSSEYSTMSPNRGLNRVASPTLSSTTEQTEGELGIDAFLQSLQKDTVESSQAKKDSHSNAESVRPASRDRRQPPPRPRRPSERDLPTSDMSDPDTVDFVARSNSRLHSRNSSRNDSEPEVAKNTGFAPALRPPPLLTSRYGNDTSFNSLHTPSDSGLSDDSYASSGFRSAASSRSSPPGSVVGHSREASKLSHTDHNVEERAPWSGSPESYGERRPSRGAGSHVRPDGSRTVPRSLSPGYPNPPESPMDPAIQRGTFARRPSELGPPIDPATIPGRSPPRNISHDARQPEVHRPKVPSKGNCRGCSEPIVGKSVKDSSGRLTGRYHKQCFVCRTCAGPFPTAEFYVFENSPYCEHHYHKLNGSLCGACNRGIEGQYLETDMRRKYHPRCFTCTTCRIVLRDGYFDVNGRRYCDRHAQSAAAPPRHHLGPGGYKPRNLQKRGTRLMMMA